MEQNIRKTNWDIIVIGGGQSGLAMGYHLKLLNKDFIILDASENIGDSWRLRWDSLRLFTPSWAIKYPGYNFPVDKNTFPTKNQLAGFLEDYAIRFQLPIFGNMKVISLSKTNEGYEITTEKNKFTCKKVIVATGNYAVAKIPSFAKELDRGIYQLSSANYKRPSDLPDGVVLVAGAGTSGLQIALDLAASGKKVYVSGTPPGKIPPFMLKYFGKLMIWMMSNRMTINTRPGRKLRDDIKIKGKAAPLIKISIEEVKKAGVEHIPRIKANQNGYPLLEDGRIIRPSTIVWCTGFTRDFSWIRNMDGIADEHNYPVTYRGVSTTHRGLYFLGMAFQYALTSTWILGVGRDAAYIADHIQQNP